MIFPAKNNFPRNPTNFSTIKSVLFAASDAQSNVDILGSIVTAVKGLLIGYQGGYNTETNKMTRNDLGLAFSYQDVGFHFRCTSIPYEYGLSLLYKGYKFSLHSMTTVDCKFHAFLLFNKADCTEIPKLFNYILDIIWPLKREQFFLVFLYLCIVSLLLLPVEKCESEEGWRLITNFCRPV